MERLRNAFDPERRLNPGKILPGGGGCGEGAGAAAASRAANGHGDGAQDERGRSGRAGVPAQLGGMRPGDGAGEGPWI